MGGGGGRDGGYCFEERLDLRMAWTLVSLKPFGDGQPCRRLLFINYQIQKLH
jgi:hypothetical protein